MPYRKIKVHDVYRTLHLPGGQRVICYSSDGAFRVWDLETGTQVEEWEDKDQVEDGMVSSPSGEMLATGDLNGAVKLWNVDTGKIIKTLTGHTGQLRSMSWSSDGGRVVCGSWDCIFRVWDVKSGETILGPINAGLYIWAVCYSPDGKTIATTLTGGKLKIWDANSGELLKTLDADPESLNSTQPPGQTSTQLSTISLSPNERILAGTPQVLGNTAYLWNLETDQLIKTLHHLTTFTYFIRPTFSADGKFLVTSCRDGYLYRWDLSAIVKEAGLPLEILPKLDATPRPAPKSKGAPRIPPGFFDDDLRKANERIRLSQSHGPYHHPTPAPRRRTLDRVYSLWRRSKSQSEADHRTRPQSHPLSWTRNLGILRRRDASDIELQEVEVPYTAGKPRNYHARKKKKPVTDSSRHSNIHTTQQPNGAAQSTSTSSQLPPPTATAGVMGTPSRPHITRAGWCTRFVAWICCASIQNADGHH
ncbi:WD40-repeat-containing domain protein [Suillus bovinus]|uniref:WD40-repeat-containing domain protein n=1 Tax=Suillus bovinus TaxID=48563 RepID=UPI001B87DB08|nr:WD40-repeat-containing domain protein [Suillus bovinus]KAG2133817.1 WD40-repeat-containing domain protein [Suillus bovinus]